jgi:hypothetical protein
VDLAVAGSNPVDHPICHCMNGYTDSWHNHPLERREKKVLKSYPIDPIWNCMTISNAPTSLLDSVLTAQNTRQDIGVAVLKKAQDAMKQQGEAMVKMLEQAGGQHTGDGKSLLDVYA